MGLLAADDVPVGPLAGIAAEALGDDQVLGRTTPASGAEVGGGTLGPPLLVDGDLADGQAFLDVGGGIGGIEISAHGSRHGDSFVNVYCSTHLRLQTDSLPTTQHKCGKVSGMLKDEQDRPVHPFYSHRLRDR